MELKEKLSKIKDEFKERVEKDEIEDSMSLRDLGLDSLDVVEMCLDLEEEYNIHFETSELSKYKTVGDLFDSIEQKLIK